MRWDRSAENKPFKCPVPGCKKSFSMRGSLNSHLSNCHSAEELRSLPSAPTGASSTGPEANLSVRAGEENSNINAPASLPAIAQPCPHPGCTHTFEHPLKLREHQFGASPGIVAEHNFLLSTVLQLADMILSWEGKSDFEKETLRLHVANVRDHSVHLRIPGDHSVPLPASAMPFITYQNPMNNTLNTHYGHFPDFQTCVEIPKHGFSSMAAGFHAPTQAHHPARDGAAASFMQPLSHQATSSSAASAAAAPYFHSVQSLYQPSQVLRSPPFAASFGHHAPPPPQPQQQSPGGEFRADRPHVWQPSLREALDNGYAGGPASDPRGSSSSDPRDAAGDNGSGAGATVTAMDDDPVAPSTQPSLPRAALPLPLPLPLPPPLPQQQQRPRAASSLMEPVVHTMSWEEAVFLSHALHHDATNHDGGQHGGKKQRRSIVINPCSSVKQFHDRLFADELAWLGDADALFGHSTSTSPSINGVATYTSGAQETQATGPNGDCSGGGGGGGVSDTRPVDVATGPVDATTMTTMTTTTTGVKRVRP